jgi:nucleoside-diphosphate-sugar epimerase
VSVDRAIVTGASGFVGRQVAARLGESAVPLSLGRDDWRESIERSDFQRASVLHLAARVPDRAAGERDFHGDNVEKTRVLAQHAASGGARRMVFLSTIKVNGERTEARPFRPGDLPAPADAYARSKWAAEQALAAIAAETGLEIVIVRAPLVYGRQARGALRALARLADSALPLPFAALDNRRSFIHVDDLARALVAAAASEPARGRTLLVAHRETVSTARLVATMRARLSRPPRLFRLPRGVLEAAAALAGASARMRSLTRSLEIDAASAEALLGWRAEVGPEEAIADVVAAARDKP